MAKIKKAQKGLMSPKDSMMYYGKQYDSLSTEAAKKIGAGKDASKDINAAKKARANETRLSKKVYGTGPGVPQKKKGGKIKKAQIGKKLPLGASSAEAEKDYSKSDSLRNVSNKMTGMDWLKNVKSGKPNPRTQSDSLKREGDRKTKATGGVPKDMRLKKGGSMKKSMKMGGKMSKGKKC